MIGKVTLFAFYAAVKPCNTNISVFPFHYHHLFAPFLGS